MNKIENIQYDEKGRIKSFEINVDNPKALRFGTVNKAYEEAKKMLRITRFIRGIFNGITY